MKEFKNLCSVHAPGGDGVLVTLRPNLIESRLVISVILLKLPLVRHAGLWFGRRSSYILSLSHLFDVNYKLCAGVLSRSALR